jgi:choline kinase
MTDPASVTTTTTTTTTTASTSATTAIIVAAGRGRRLGPETAELPKCMVRIAGRPILHRQMAALAAAGARHFVIVRGYLGERIVPAPGHDVRFVENPEWASNNILTSLMFAEPFMADEFLFSYSDIVFAADHAHRVASADLAGGGIALVVDRLWRETYVGRVHHPISEAELVSVTRAMTKADGPAREAGGRSSPATVVDRVGKTVVAADDAVGEFIGLARFSREGAAALRREWQRARSAPGGLEGPYGRAAHLRQAYLSDAFNALAAQGEPLTPVFVDGRWREIDTEEDLARAHGVVDGWDAGPTDPLATGGLGG